MARYNGHSFVATRLAFHIAGAIIAHRSCRRCQHSKRTRVRQMFPVDLFAFNPGYDRSAACQPNSQEPCLARTLEALCNGRPFFLLNSTSFS
jgi:hypothetical protein